jgi:hypothetical protein
MLPSFFWHRPDCNSPSVVYSFFRRYRLFTKNGNDLQEKSSPIIPAVNDSGQKLGERKFQEATLQEGPHGVEED